MPPCAVFKVPGSRFSVKNKNPEPLNRACRESGVMGGAILIQGVGNRKMATDSRSKRLRAAEACSPRIFAMTNLFKPALARGVCANASAIKKPVIPKSCGYVLCVAEKMSNRETVGIFLFPIPSGGRSIVLHAAGALCHARQGVSIRGVKIRDFVEKSHNPNKPVAILG